MNKKRIELEEKHYKRMKNFLEFDIEEREVEEQKIILLQTINACKDILNNTNVKKRKDKKDEEVENEKQYKKE